jgi:predicted nuclease of restriction endonuclease-like (RecB) superfamily
MARKQASSANTQLVRRNGQLSASSPRVSKRLLGDLRRMIDDSRQIVAQTVNAALVWLYWSLGKRIREDLLKQKRAEYGQRILYALSRELTATYGRGFSEPNLRHMCRFAEVFGDKQIVSSLMRQLSWTHFRTLLYLDDPLQRDFYAEMCRVERWSVRTLRQKIDGMLYERTALSKKPEKLVRQELANLRDGDLLTPDLVFRDPYFLDFLGLTDTWGEKDLEAAILRELEAFILELGVGFAFVARQKRITVGGEDYYLDLLFYHRGLRRLVALDLKLGRFQPADKGQMELYLRWLERHEQQPGEESPIGLILCAGKSDEQIELLRLDDSGIRVAAYMTELPPREVLQKKLHDAVREARARLESRGKDRE